MQEVSPPYHSAIQTRFLGKSSKEKLLDLNSKAKSTQLRKEQLWHNLLSLKLKKESIIKNLTILNIMLLEHCN